MGFPQKLLRSMFRLIQKDWRKLSESRKLASKVVRFVAVKIVKSFLLSVKISMVILMTS